MCTLSWAQEKSAPPKSVTVPAMIDHNRVVIHVDVRLPDGSTVNVHAWVDNGDPELNMSRHLATLLALPVTCDEHECSSPPPKEIFVGAMAIPLESAKEAKIPLRPVIAASVLAAGMTPEINLPASILCHYDVLVDFPGHKFSIGAPGTLHFQGSSAKVQINAQNGLIQVPSQIDGKKYNLALDLGSNFSFLSADVFEKLTEAHLDWPHMTGAVGSANMGGSNDEPNWKLMRLERLQYGPLFLANPAFAEFPKDRLDYFAKRAGIPTAGLLGSNNLTNYRVGINYAHSTVYFDLGRTFTFPDFDVIGLVLRPEDDGQYTILGVADSENQPSVPEGTDGIHPGDHLIAVNDIPVRGSTMGQVWSMLGGTPGQERRLTIERAGKRVTVNAQVRHFLGETPADPRDNRN